MCIRLGRVALTSMALLGLAACAGQPPSESSLYDELGGEHGIAAIVDGLIHNVAADERIRHHFRGIHVAGFRDRLETHFCDVAGGPCEWTGRSMREAHENLGIHPAAFNALVEALIDAMDDLAIGQGAQNAFLARLAPMQSEVVSAD